MDEWMDGWMDEWMDGLDIDQQTCEFHTEHMGCKVGNMERVWKGCLKIIRTWGEFTSNISLWNNEEHVFLG